MIYLHLDDKAAGRIERLAGEVSGEVLKCELGRGQALDPERISSWLASASAPELIVVTGAQATNRGERRAFESLRRISKFKGIDVHMAGDRSVADVADVTVTRDEDLQMTAPGSSVGEQITALIRSEDMTPLERAEMDIPTVKEAIAATGCTEAEAVARINWMKSQSVWANNLYQVNVEYLPENKAHIIIRRLDKQPIHNWVHFQQIKNQLLGPECEAVEIYPKESKLVDAKHHYHLWGFRSPSRTYGIGFDQRQVSYDD